MINREVLREYTTGSLWVLPGASAVAALLLGFAVAHLDVEPGSVLAPLAFQGTADDARALMIDITSTVVTVIALVLGPDRGRAAIVLDPVLATTAAQLLARPAKSGRAEHVRRDLRLHGGRPLHGRRARRDPHRTVPAPGGQRRAPADVRQSGHGRVLRGITWPIRCRSMPSPNESSPARSGSCTATWAARKDRRRTSVVGGSRSGPTRRDICRRCTRPTAADGRAPRHAQPAPGPGRRTRRAGAPCWAGCGTRPTGAPPPSRGHGPRHQTCGAIGFERTQEQDAASASATCRHGLQGAVSRGQRPVHSRPGGRSPVGHLLCDGRPTTGRRGRAGSGRTAVVIVPARRFGDYLATMCGLIRRYGSSEPTLTSALLRLLANCAAVFLPDDADRWAALDEQADLVIADATPGHRAGGRPAPGPGRCP